MARESIKARQRKREAMVARYAEKRAKYDRGEIDADGRAQFRGGGFGGAGGGRGGGRPQPRRSRPPAARRRRYRRRPA